jgi:hypothetical protein
MTRNRSCNAIVEGAISRELFAAVNWNVSESTGWPAGGDVDDDLLRRVPRFFVHPAPADSQHTASDVQEFLREVTQARLRALSVALCGEPIREMKVSGSSKEGWWLQGQAEQDFKLPDTRGCRTWEEAVEAAESWIRKHLVGRNTDGP